MKKISKYILSFALTLLCFSCTDTDVEEFSVGNSLGDGRVGVTLNVTTPESFSYLTRAISEENESVLEDKFTVFAFSDNGGEAGNLIFTVKTGDVNTESNLDSDNTYSSSYGDYTTSPSIAWHEDSSGVGGRLYIEYYETQGPIHLFVLANVDIEKVETLLEGSDPAIQERMSFSDVTEALQPALDFDVTDESLTSIPMTGECELENGITLGSTGSLSLRRSVAKFTVRVEYERERVLEDFGESIDYAPFQPNSIIIENLNATYATVYSPSSSDPNISTLNEEVSVPYSPSFTFDDWVLDESSDTYYKEIVFYVAETQNSRQDAYTNNNDGTYTENANPRISVLVMGTYNDFSDGTVIDNNWYRLDLIPEGATSSDEELVYILRNHHYKFVLSDVTKRGSSSRQEALELSIPDNEPHVGSGDAYVIIEDESILSVTVDTSVDGNDENYQPYYVGVSNTDIEIDVYYGTTACARVKVVTNYDGWTLDPYSIPEDEEGNPAISFVWDSSAETLWLWLDDPEAVEVGQTYVYYIVAGNIRKKMRVTIIDTTEEQEP